MCSVTVEGRLAIRAARFGPEADVLVREVGEKSHGAGIFRNSKKWGAIEGPIRIPLDSSLFLFNALALLDISSKSLKFQSVLFSIPTAPTNLLSYQHVR